MEIIIIIITIWFLAKVLKQILSCMWGFVKICLYLFLILYICQYFFK